MHFASKILAPLCFIPLLNQCGTFPAPGPNASTGPFDSRGNYIEEWADQPSKWKKTNVPTPPAPSEIPQPAPPTPQPTPPPEIAISRPTPPPTPTPTVSTPKPTPTPTVSKPKPKPKPKPTIVKAKPKPKPKPVIVRHTVSKGENLLRIASRYGSSVSKIQQANSIQGSTIRIGQRLIIPK